MAVGYQAQDIVETSSNYELSQSQCEQKHQLSNLDTVSIYKKDCVDSDSKYQSFNIPCLLCKSSNHPALRCLQTRQLRDGEKPMPLDL